MYTEYIYNSSLLSNTIRHTILRGESKLVTENNFESQE